MLRSLVLAACLLVSFASASSADERPAAPHTVAPIKFQKVPGAKTNRLIIPKQYVKQLKTASVDTGIGSSRTILAGLLMTVAVGSGVLLLKPKGALRWAAPTVMGLCALGAAGLALADIPVEPQPLQVMIEVVERGDAVVFTYAGR